MLIRKVPFIHGFKSFTFRRCGGLRANATNKVPLSDQGKKRSINFLEIKSADSTEWARWYLDMSAEDEMRAQKITFILCMELSLKTSLNSALSGEHCVMLVLAFQSFIFLSAPSWSAKLTSTSKKQSLARLVWAREFERVVVIYWGVTHVWPYCLRGRAGWGERKSWDTGAEGK